MAKPIYSSAEIIDIARQIEACGEAFYGAAARTVSEPRVRDVFLRLQKEEQKHSAKFEQVLSQVKADPDHNRDNENYQVYMQALVESRVFSSPHLVDEAVAGLRGPHDAVELALKFEKEAVLFLGAFRRMVRDGDKAAVDELIEEEERHVVQLNRVSKDLRAAK